MSEMIDRLAKTIDPIAFGTYADEDIDPRHGVPWSSTRFAIRKRAEACILALRDPTPAMRGEGSRVGAGMWWDVDELAVWQAMIDEALK